MQGSVANGLGQSFWDTYPSLTHYSKNIISEEISIGFTIGKPCVDHDSFFTACAEVFKNIHFRFPARTKEWSAQSLRELLYSYCKKGEGIETEDDYWVKTAVRNTYPDYNEKNYLKDKKYKENIDNEYKNYLNSLRFFPSQFSASNKDQDIELGEKKPMVPRLDIEGLMLCRRLNIVLHIIIIPNYYPNEPIKHLIVTPLKQYPPMQLTQIAKAGIGKFSDYQKVVNLLFYKNQFTPLYEKEILTGPQDKIVESKVYVRK